MTLIGHPDTNAVARQRIILTPWLLVGPVLILFVVFFAVPILIMFASSLDRLDLATFKVMERFTLFNYRKFLFDRFYFGVLLTTLKMSLFVTLACLVTGYPLAVYLTKASTRERGLILLLIISPLVVSLVIRSFGWVIVLGPRAS